MWESLYIFPASFGVGLLNSSQFVGVSATVEKSQLATTISIFFLSQQMGLMTGASGSGALLQKTFRNVLEKRLGDSAQESEVINFYCTLFFSRRILPLPTDTGGTPANTSSCPPPLDHQRNTQRYKVHAPSTQGLARSGTVKLCSRFRLCNK